MSHTNDKLTTGAGEDATITTTRLDENVDTRGVGVAASVRATGVTDDEAASASTAAEVAGGSADTTATPGTQTNG